MKVVVEGSQIAGNLAAVREAAAAAQVVHVTDRQSLLREVADAEVLFVGQFGVELVEAAPKLKWLQTSGAGVEWLPREQVRARGWTVTNAAGVHAIPVAETAVALMLGVARRLHWAVRSQVAHIWNRPPDIFEIYGKTAGVIALGGIGEEFARRVKGLAMRVLAVDLRRNVKPDSVDELRSLDGLAWLLGQSDVVCMTAPLTPQSHHLMNAERFAQMKPGSIFLNVSRGGLVDTQALIGALESGRLYGAGLDVVEEEPLPPTHPLWKRDDVLITTHIGGTSPRRGERLAELFCRNLALYREGKPLINVVDLAAGF